MANKTVERDRVHWRLPFYALLGTWIAFLALTISQPTSIPYVFVVIPILSIFADRLCGMVRNCQEKATVSRDIVDARCQLGYFRAVS